jgi:hypothetical protein
MERVRSTGRVILAAGIAVAITLLAKGLYPADLPASPNPDFVDNMAKFRRASEPMIECCCL